MVEDTIVLPNHHVTQTDRDDSKKPSRFSKWFKTKKKIESPELVLPNSMKKKRGLQPWHKIMMVLLLVLLVLGSAAGAAAYYTLGIVKTLQSQSNELKVSVNVVKDQLKTQNLPGAKTALADVQTKLDGMKVEYQKLSYLGAIPLANLYFQDGQHGFAAAEAGVRAGVKTIDAVVPYADVLGFAGAGSFTGGSAENRIKLLIDTLGKVSPVLDDIKNELTTADNELAQINSNRYPEKFGSVEIKSNLIAGQTAIKEVVAGIDEFRPAIEVLPQVAGGNGKRQKYLMIFQNDNELRATGGFMTGYAVLYVEDGKVTPEKSDDIYELDKKFSSKTPIPAILGKYLTTEKKFNMRDMNISPDFKLSMDTFYSNYQLIKSEPQSVDGIISVDSEFLASLVKVLGPVDVPGYGTFSAESDKRCDCPQIIYALSEIVDRPTPYLRTDRKGILAPMMQAILHKAYSSPKEVWPDLFALARENIEQKHVQMYFFNEEYQKAAEAVNVAGRMNSIKEGHDYTAIVDANLGGAKSNLFVTQEVEEKVSPVENGLITKTLTLKYKNPFPGSNCNLEAGQLCLNAILKDWVRVYLPKGAKITKTQGFDEGTESETEEEGLAEFKVIQGVFRLSPQSNATVVIDYTVPYTNETTYKLQLRKQGGTGNVKYVIDVNGNQQEVILDKDKTVEIPF
ncbi:MAG: DUF4012 domain-containing protein [Patescibacteria group bacterium]